MKQKNYDTNDTIELFGFALILWVKKHVFTWAMTVVIVITLVTHYYYNLPIETIGVIDGTVLLLSYIGCVVYGIYRTRISDDDPIDDNDEE